MSTINHIDEIFEELVKRGSDIPYLTELRDRSISEIKKDKPLSEVLTGITGDVEYLSSLFLEKENNFDTKLITGLSTGIYLPDENGKFKYTLVGGKRSRYREEKVDFDTVFDLASITKLYTILLAFKLEEMGLIDLDSRVQDVNPTFRDIGVFTFNDLIKLYGELRTDGNIATAKSYEEAVEIFKTLYLVSDDKTKIKYNDFGSMVIADTIEKIMSKELGRKVKFDEIMYEYLLKPLGINSTMFTPQTNNVSGNSIHGNMPHDPKSRALGGVTGHAGLFSNSEGLMRLAEAMFTSKASNVEHLKRLSQKTFEGMSKGAMGLYLKHPDGYKATYNPQEFSNESFTSQGWTGSIASFDMKNQIHNNILVNAISEEEPEKVSNNKPKGFASAMDEYQMEVVKRIMLMYVIKKYYNKFCNVKEDIEIMHTL